MMRGAVVGRVYGGIVCVGMLWPWVAMSGDGGLFRLRGSPERGIVKTAHGWRLQWAFVMESTSEVPVPLEVLGSSCSCLDVSVEPQVLMTGGQARVVLQLGSSAAPSAAGWAVVRGIASGRAQVERVAIDYRADPDPGLRIAPRSIACLKGAGEARLQFILVLEHGETEVESVSRRILVSRGGKAVNYKVHVRDWPGTAQYTGDIDISLSGGEHDSAEMYQVSYGDDTRYAAILAVAFRAE